MKLKVCGMKYNTTQVAQLQPDYLGFIFYEQSPRNFENRLPEIPKSIKKVGVFVDKEIDFIKNKTEEHNLDCVQLHGNESPEFCQKLKQFCDSALDAESINKDKMLKQVQHDKIIKIIKVFSIKDKFNFEVIRPYEDVCDYFLFDTKGRLPGGNGYTFDWNVLNNYPSTKPYFLSGGIGIDQVEKIKEFQKSKASKYCYAIDVNSKFEIKAGLKKIEELKKFKSQV